MRCIWKHLKSCLYLAHRFSGTQDLGNRPRKERRGSFFQSSLSIPSPLQSLPHPCRRCPCQRIMNARVCWAAGLRVQEATRRYKHFHCKGCEILANDGPKEVYIAQYWVWKILASESRVPKEKEASESCVLSVSRNQGFLILHGSHCCSLALPGVSHQNLPEMSSFWCPYFLFFIFPPALIFSLAFILSFSGLFQIHSAS